MSPSSSRPRVTLKLATSLDGKIALANGRSQWITGPQSRDQVHHLRAMHDVILTGVGSVLADDPQMTARPGGVVSHDQPQRVILDTHLRTPADAQILKGAPVWIFHGPDAVPMVQARHVPTALDAQDRLSLPAVLEHLSAQGMRTVMIEAGAGIAAAAVKAECVDTIEWFRAPKLIGGEGRPCAAALGLETLDETPIFRREKLQECGDDLWETYQRG